MHYHATRLYNCATDKNKNSFIKRSEKSKTDIFPHPDFNLATIPLLKICHYICPRNILFHNFIDVGLLF